LRISLLREHDHDHIRDEAEQRRGWEHAHEHPDVAELDGQIHEVLVYSFPEILHVPAGFDLLDGDQSPFQF
jgi:hypothetical protein